MNVVSAAHPLRLIADALQRSGLGESVLVGTMGASIYGANVLTDDFDFLVPQVHDLPRRIRNMARILNATIYPPKRPYGTTMLFMNDENIRIDLMVRMDGVRSFRALRTRSELHPEIGNTHVASLRDIIRSKRAAGRPKDLAILPELEATLDEIESEKR